MQTDIIIIIGSLFFSALFSGWEIALVSANRLRLELDKQESNRPWLYKMYRHPGKMIATFLLGNNAALVIYGLGAAHILEPWIQTWFWIGQNEFGILLAQTLISTVVILIIAEFIPKVLFSLNPNKTLKIFSLPIFIIYNLFKPIANSVYAIAKFLLKWTFSIEMKEDTGQFSSTELKELVLELDEGAPNTSIGESEKEILKNAIDFRSVKLRECMIPRTEIAAIEVTDSIQELEQLFTETGHSKILVYRENIDNIIGYVHAFDLFKKPSNIGKVLRSIPFVPETMLAHLALSKFIKENKSIAVVVDEFGGTGGMVSMEDIMEEIFGDIQDEHDHEAMVEKQISKTEYIFSARLEVDYLNETYKLELPEGEDYETLAGYLITQTGHIPEVKETIEVAPYSFTIEKASNNRLELIRVIKHSSTPSN